MLWPELKGPAVVNVLTIETSATGDALPPLPVLSVLFAGLGSGSAAATVELLSKAPGALIVAVTVIVVLAPLERLAMVQGSAEQPPPLTLVIVRFDGVSVTWMLVAVDGPALATSRVYVSVWPWR